MLPELGNFALIIALCLAVLQSSIPLIGASRSISTYMAAARPLAVAQFLFLAFAFICLGHAFVASDFSVLYVAQNSNTATPLIYRICGIWGGHEGSLLLWVFILSIWGLAVSYFSRSLPQDMLARVLSVLGMVGVGFLLFMLLTSNPFNRLLPDVPANGQDLNPLLQDPGLAIHPPMLYMGYVGFSVAFAFAIATLLSGRLDAAWARWSRPWTIAAWCFLTFGITLGSWWSYNELGWGGWWFWDPVENASFLPWLVGTALIHSLAVTEKRGVFKGWTVLLAIFAFSLSLLGTFLVRSGVLTSVHAFAVDPQRGLFMLVFLSIVVVSSLTLYAFKVPTVHKDGFFKLLSRETFLLSNNILLTVAAATVLLGTLYPLLIDALGMGKISVGPPYFNAVFIPIMMPLLFIIGVGPSSRWKQTSAAMLVKQLWKALVLSAVLGMLLPWLITGDYKGYVAVSMMLVFWIFLTAGIETWEKVKHREQPIQGLLKLPLSYYGMSIAHLGVAVTVVGIALTTAYHVQRDVRMAPGDSVAVAGYTFTFTGTQQISGSNYTGTSGLFNVSKNGKHLRTMTAEKRIYTVQQMPMTEASVDPGFTRDLYIAMGEPLGSNAWAVRLYVKPFVRWIWLGGLLMIIGGIFSIIDRRYRNLAKKQSEKLVIMT